MSPVGLSYVRGRVDNSTIEGGAPVREIGQYGATSPHRSCPVRSASGHRVRLTMGPMVPVISDYGALVIYLDPDNASNGGGQQASGLVFDWRTDANNRITLHYDKAGTQWTLTRLQSGAGGGVSVSDTFTAGAQIALYAAWGSGTIEIAVDGGAITSTANGQSPTLPTTADVGSQDGATASTYFNGAFGAIAIFGGALTASQWQALAALRDVRPPVWGEAGTESLMTGLWYGGHGLVWSLPTSGGALDMNDAAGGDVLLFEGGIVGAGLPAIQHRAVETPLRDGASYVDSRLMPRFMVAPVMTRGLTTQAELWALRRTVLAAMNPRAGVGVVQYAPSTTVYEISALVSGGLGFDAGRGALIQQPAIQFRCDDPAWRIATRTDTSATIPLGGWSITWTIPWTLSATAVTVPLTNSGDLDSYPIVEITAGSVGLVGPYANNLTTGEVFVLNGLSLAAGAVLTIDMDARTATVAGASVLGYRTAASRMWPLERGANNISVGAQSGSGTAVVKFYSRLIGV